MRLTGLPWSQLAWVLGAALAWTLALYLLRQRHRVVVVPHLALWQTVLATRRSARLGTRVRRLVSLLLALAIAAALGLSLGNPEVAGDDRGPTKTVLLIDVSPSMATREVDPDGRSGGKASRISRLAMAKRLARAAVHARAPEESMLVVQMGAVPTPMDAFTRDTQALLDAIDKLELGYREANLSAALHFAGDATADPGVTGARTAPGATSARAVVFSDGQVDTSHLPSSAPSLAVEYARVGRKSSNLGITALSLRRYPLDRDNHETFVEVVNAGKDAARAELRFRSEGKLIRAEPLALPADSRVRRIYPNIAGVEGALEAQLVPQDNARDAMALDNRAYAAVPAHRRARILCVTEGNLYLQAALLIDEHLEVETVTPQEYAASPGAPAGHDVVIFDDSVPAQPPGIAALFLHPATSGPGNPVQVTGEVEAPYFDHLKRNHPLLRHTALKDVNIANALRVRPAPGDEIVGAARDTPLLIRGQRAGVPFIVLSFRPADSDLPLRVAWPLLLLNAIDLLQPADDIQATDATAGTFARIPTTLSKGDVVLHGPPGTFGGRVVDGELRFVASQPGVYWAGRPGEAGSTPKLPIAVNLGRDVDPHIAPRAELPIAAGSAASGTRTAGSAASGTRTAGSAASGTRTAGSAAAGTKTAGSAASGTRTAGSAVPFAPGPARDERDLWTWLLVFAAALLLIESWTFHRRWTV